MSLDDIRDASRAAVHAEFALPAVATSPDGAQSIAINARLHREIKKPFGDLDREGFALMIESYNQIIIDTVEWVPKKNWKIDFGRGRVVNIDNIDIVRGERYTKCQVSEVRP